MLSQVKQHPIYLNLRVASFTAGILFIVFVLVIINTVVTWLPQKQNFSNQLLISHPKQDFKLSDISTWHLMGFSVTNGLPQTNLQLTLQGVLVMSNPAQSSAIIADQSQTAKVYSVGDVLPGGAILDKVLANEVIIKNRGRLEELPLVRPKLQFAPPPPSMWQ